jgi:hypothetical protein
MSSDLLEIEEIAPGTQKVSLNIQELYSGLRNQKENFEQRLSDFLSSDDCSNKIFERQGDLLVYQTECIIPKKRDSRRPLLLLLGNPACHSVKKGMFFSYEGDGREHRFWKSLDESKILSFSIEEKDLDLRNEVRKQKLFDLNYDSPFRIGLAVFFSMPSPSSGKWGGVAGLKRLFRKEAFKRMSAREKERIGKLITEFVAPDGIVVSFQKDAYLQIRSSDNRNYSLKEAMAGKLEDVCQCNCRIRLYCFAPTRLMQKNKILLNNLRIRYSI